MEIIFKPIGVIYTPYVNSAPYQPVKNDKGIFKIVVFDEYADGLGKLEEFDYIYVLYYLNRISGSYTLKVNPPWRASSGSTKATEMEKVGIFATRSPKRPNPIGLSIVKIKGMKKNTIYISGIDTFNKTPLLDIKPYIRELDSLDDSNYGWIKSEEDYNHLLLHIKGLPHDF